MRSLIHGIIGVFLLFMRPYILTIPTKTRQRDDWPAIPGRYLTSDYVYKDPISNLRREGDLPSHFKRVKCKMSQLFIVMYV